jgi:hypothetical protein
MLLDTTALPDDLVWANEFEWNQNIQSQNRTLSGALDIQTATHLYGRPIHLVGGTDGGWITRSTALAIRALEADPSAILTLTGLLDHPAMSVVFDRSGPASFESQMIMRYSDPNAGTFYSCALRLITVASPT